MADLQIKVDQLITHPPIVNSADRVFETVEIDITKSVAPHPAASSYAAASRLLATSDPTSHWALVTGWSPPTCRPRSKVRISFPPLCPLTSLLSKFFALNQAIPQQEFPKFDGMYPKLWKKRVES
jgi:hypothetical protein